MSRSLFCAAAVGFALVAGAASAQPAPNLDNLFARADVNHDGRVTRAAFQASLVGRFRDLDRNHDGFLSSADIPSAVIALRQGAPRLMRTLRQFDRNGDGKVSLDEFIAGSIRMFDDADANHDGVVTRAEADAEIGRIRLAVDR